MVDTLRHLRTAAHWRLLHQLSSARRDWVPDRFGSLASVYSSIRNQSSRTYRSRIRR